MTPNPQPNSGLSHTSPPSGNVSSNQNNSYAYPQQSTSATESSSLQPRFNSFALPAYRHPNPASAADSIGQPASSSSSPFPHNPFSSAPSATAAPAVTSVADSNRSAPQSAPYRSSQQQSQNQLLQPSLTTPSSSTFSGSAAKTAGGGGGSAGSGLPNLSVGQIHLLIATINDRNYDTKVKEIWKITNSNMDVQHRVLRKLINDNYSYITGATTTRGADFRVLVDNVKLISSSPETSKDKFADAITFDASEPCLEGFDLAVLMNALQLDAFQRAILAVGFKTHREPELQKKGMEILHKNFASMLEILAMPSKYENLSDNGIAWFVEQIVTEPLPNFVDESIVLRLSYAVRCRYKNKALPTRIAQLTNPIEEMRQQENLVSALEQFGPDSISTLERARELVSRKWNVHITEKEVAEVLIYMACRTQNPGQWNSANFVDALIAEGNLAPTFDWEVVLDNLDREDFIVRDMDGVMVVIRAIQAGTKGQRDFPIAFWGRQWQYPRSQWSVLSAYLQPQTDVRTLPGLRKIFTSDDFETANSHVKAMVTILEGNKLISYDAIDALLHLSFDNTVPQDIHQAAQRQLESACKFAPELVLCGALQKPQPWTLEVNDLVGQLFDIFFEGHTSYQLIFHRLWNLDRPMVARRFIDYYNRSRLNITRIMDISQDLRCLGDLLEIPDAQFVLDIATLAARREYLNLEKWLQGMLSKYGAEFWHECYRFLRIKAAAEYEHAREGVKQTHVSLRVGPVYTMLTVLDESGVRQTQEIQEQVTQTQRLCIQAYPRLVNLGGKHDAIVLANNAESNTFATQVDKDMQAAYRKLYAQEIEIAEVVQYLQQLRDSDDPVDQDLFCCMVHGLFDEYDCYPSYPISALATTAVLFGSLIRYRVIGGIPLRVALAMVYQAIRDNTSSTQMYKFGLQALMQFMDRLPEWRSYCVLLAQVPGLQGTEAWRVVQEVLTSPTQRLEPSLNGTGETGDDVDDIPNGEPVPSTPSQTYPPFRSIHADEPHNPYAFEDPDESIQDKILFIINNLSQSNLEVKLEDLRKWLSEPHYRWFADYLVVNRAKKEQNNHALYLNLIETYGDKSLAEEVLRGTYISIQKLFNNESTLVNNAERTHLKCLGAWLGGLTIAKDRPIRFKNISFKDLLIEGFQTDRLAIVMPFTCKVLEQGQYSTAFKPPNPWVMAILGLLKELYGRVNKLNLKFEVEVLCKTFQLNVEDIPASTVIQEIEERQAVRAETEADQAAVLQLENLSIDHPHDYHSFSTQIPQQFMDGIAVNSVIRDGNVKRIVLAAIERTAQEIIGPVVERSVTIAAIATSQLILKDFATEPDEKKMRQAAVGMARRLAGHLALVTCKEPMRLSMMNNIRTVLVQNGIGDNIVSEQAISMIVNENLEFVCQTVESAAESSAVPHVDETLAQSYAQRRQFREQRNRPNTFMAPGISRYAMQHLPDVFRLHMGGLTPAQYAVYEEFARGGSASNVEPRSQHQQIMDAQPGEYLQGNFAPGFEGPQMEPAQAPSPPQADAKVYEDNIMSYVGELRRTIRECDENHFTELDAGHPIISYMDKIITSVAGFSNSSRDRDDLAQRVASALFHILFSQDVQNELEVEIFSFLVRKLCDISPNTAKDVVTWLTGDQEDDRIFNVLTIVNLVRLEILSPQLLDEMMSKKIAAHNSNACEFLAKLLEQTQLQDRPILYRTDFAASLEAVGEWSRQDPNNERAQELFNSLQGVEAEVSYEGHNRVDQLEYIFMEWVTLYQHLSTTEKNSCAFVIQLSNSKLMSDLESLGDFLRTAFEHCFEEFINASNPPGVSLGTNCYIPVDALAKLVMYLARFQSGLENEKLDKADYLDSLLALVIILFNHSIETRANNQAFLAAVSKVTFRFFSTLFYEMKEAELHFQDHADRILDVLANAVMALQPAYFPTFAFHWATLVGHRYFMPLFMESEKGRETYTKLLVIFLRFVGHCVVNEPPHGLARILHQGALRLFLVIHHDFADYLVEWMMPLVNSIPPVCIQLRNLVLSALPTNVPDFGDPFRSDQEVTEVENIGAIPVICGDYLAALRLNGLKEILDHILREKSASEEDARTVIGRLHRKEEWNMGAFDQEALNSLVLYLGTAAISSLEKAKQPAPSFNPSSVEVELFSHMVTEFTIAERYHFLSSIANHLRFPNAHTYWFHRLMLHLWDVASEKEGVVDAVHEQISRVLMERLAGHRPHTWGIIMTFTKLWKSKQQQLWDMPCVRTNQGVAEFLNKIISQVESRDPLPADMQ